ncbi:Zinc finger, CCHC-type superfamily [Sesbania bispinosa]|nr:Zinc finger, CCHC-type superfamily [Sesbania bispinosa]
MPFTNDADKHAEQHGKFFMVLALAGLPPEFDSIRNQILSGIVVPSYDTVSEQLLRLSVPHMFGHSHVPSTNSSAFYSHSSYRGGPSGIRGGYRGQRPRCNFCQRYGHTEAECRTKARQQPKTANIAQVISPGASDEVSISVDAYNEFLQCSIHNLLPSLVNLVIL